MLEQTKFPSAPFFPKQNETLQIVSQHGDLFELNQKGTHLKPNRKPTSVLWVKQRVIGYRHFSLVFSLWQGLCYLSGVCLYHFWCQSKQTGKAVIRTGESQGINNNIHPSPHTHIKTLTNMEVRTQACAYTHLGVHTKEPTDVHSGLFNPESSSQFLNIWFYPLCLWKCERLSLWK